jgi:tetratricopeptide (TPR) repeat protein
MPNNLNSSGGKSKIIFYIILATLTLAVYSHISQFDFVFDDASYITENANIKLGLSVEGLHWAFTTKYLGLWNPIVWLSLMLDYDLYGMNAGAFHMTNLILHVLSTLLLFWLFHRMTGEHWKSAFVAAFFALHPLHVESVAWISERKDVLSAFFWILTLCFYVYYTEKPIIRRYLLVLFSFVLALMSKPMVITLPVIMILLDYWPLKRFENQKDLSHLILWQIKEKLPLLMLSAILVIITFFTPGKEETLIQEFPLSSRLANAPVAFMTYLGKSFWPHDMAILYPFDAHIPVWQVLGAVLIIAAIIIVVIMAFKKFPYLCIGWFWFAITILPVIGIIQISLSAPYAMADRYHYLPSIGISIMTAWGLPLVFPRKDIQKKILFPAGIIFLVSMSIFSWKQCGYWGNSIDLWDHALKVTKNNYVAHNNLGLSLFKAGHFDDAVYHHSQAIRLKPFNEIFLSNRGNAYIKLGRHQLAIQDYNDAIRIKPHSASVYINRGNAYNELGQYQKAINDFNIAVQLNPDYVEAVYNNRGSVYYKQRLYQKAIDDFSEAIRLNNSYVKAYNNRGTTLSTIGDHKNAIKDFSKTISLRNDNVEALHKRGYSYQIIGQHQLAVKDYDALIHLKQNDSAIYFNRGTAYLHLVQYEQAVDDYSKAIALNPAHFDAYNNRAFTYLSLGQYQQALEDYNKAIMLKPNYADVYNNRAFVYLMMGNIDAGCLDAKKACEWGTCSTLQLANQKGLCR